MRKKALSLALLGFFIALFGYYFFTHLNQFKILLNLNFFYLLLIAVGDLAVLFTNGLFIKWVLEPFKKNIRTKDSVYLSVVSSVGNYFGPLLGGAGVRALYLKRKHGLGYGDFLSTLSGYYVIVFLVHSLIGLVGLVGLAGHRQEASYQLLFVFLALLFISLLVLATIGFPAWLIKFLESRRALKRPTQILSGVLKGWNTIISHPKLISRLIVLTFINLGFLFLINFAALAALGYKISVWAFLLYGTLGGISLLLSFTPGSIGIREGLYIFASSTIGLNTDQILTMSIIDRSVQFLVFALAWGLLRIWKQASNNEKQES